MSKKDKDSLKADNTAKRDELHDKSFDGKEGQNPSRKKRANKKRWCKGREGKKHDLIWSDAILDARLKFIKQHWGRKVNFDNVESKDVVCKNCGKVLEFSVHDRNLWKLDPNILYKNK